jgi:hypothetical protein
MRELKMLILPCCPSSFSSLIAIKKWDEALKLLYGNRELIIVTIVSIFYPDNELQIGKENLQLAEIKYQSYNIFTAVIQSFFMQKKE